MSQDAIEQFARVVLSEDRLAATLVVEPGIDPGSLTEIVLEAMLDARGVAATTDRRARVAAAVEAIKAAPPTDAPASFIVAVGSAPVHGVHGRLEIDAELTQQPEKASAGDGSVDHYSRSAYRLARPRQIVARVVPPVPGSDGIDVTGRTLAAKVGAAAQVTHDDTIFRENDGTLRAVVPGLPEWTDHSIRIVRTLAIPGFVDFSTGHIEFPGDVTVEKGVRDCFIVRAGCDVHVHGLIEAATIESGGSTQLDSGVAGRHKASLKIGRDLRAKYLDAVRATVGRTLTVQKEITECIVEVQAGIAAPNCSVVGGEICVGGDSELAQIGTEAGIATVIRLGTIAELDRTLVELAEALPTIEGQAASARQQLDQLKSIATKHTPAQAEMLTELEFTTAQIESRAAQILGVVAKIDGVIQRFTTPRLTVHRAVFPGTVVRIGRYRAEVQREIRGPIRILLSATGEPSVEDLSSHRTSPLAEWARVFTDEKCLAVDALRARRRAA